MNWKFWETIQAPIFEKVDEIMTDNQHSCVTPIPNGWVPGMMWTCLGCGDVWVLLGSLAWDRTDLNLHSRLHEDQQQMEPLHTPLEWGVRLYTQTGAVDMRTDGQDAAESLAAHTNLVGGDETRASLVWRPLGSTTWNEAPTAASALASAAPQSPQVPVSGWPNNSRQS